MSQPSDTEANLPRWAFDPEGGIRLRGLHSLCRDGNAVIQDCVAKNHRLSKKESSHSQCKD